MMANAAIPAGGEFVISEATPEQVFVPEELDAESRVMARTIEEFVRKEVLPISDRIEAHEEGLMRCLVQQAGELGFLAANVPELYGGLALSIPAVTLLIEKAALEASFSVSVGAHTVIGTLPLLYFGAQEQKRKYLPLLASGEMGGAFAPTQATCGSD